MTSIFENTLFSKMRPNFFETISKKNPLSIHDFLTTSVLFRIQYQRNSITKLSLIFNAKLCTTFLQNNYLNITLVLF